MPTDSRRKRNRAEQKRDKLLGVKMSGTELELVYSYAGREGTTASELFRNWVRMMVSGRLPQGISCGDDRKMNPGGLSEYLAIRMSQAEIEMLRNYAQQRNIPASVLVRTMIRSVISNRYRR